MDGRLLLKRVGLSVLLTGRPTSIHVDLVIRHLALEIRNIVDLAQAVIHWIDGKGFICFVLQAHQIL